MKVLGAKRAATMGFSTDKRKRRRQHRVMARELIGAGTFLNGKAPRHSNTGSVASWHLFQARHVGR